MTLRSARTEFLLGLAQEIDNLHTRALELKMQVDEAVDASPDAKGHVTDDAQVSADELVARETIRSRAVNLQTTIRKAFDSLEALVGRR